MEEWKFAWVSAPVKWTGWAWAMLLTFVVAVVPVTVVFFLLSYLLHALLVAAVPKSRRLRVFLTASIACLHHESIRVLHLFWFLGGRSLFHAIVAHADKKELPPLAYCSTTFRDECVIAKACHRRKPPWVQALFNAIHLQDCPLCCHTLRPFCDTARRLDYWVRPGLLSGRLSGFREDPLVIRLWAGGLVWVYWDGDKGLKRLEADLAMLENCGGDFPNSVYEFLVPILAYNLRQLSQITSTPVQSLLDRFVNVVLLSLRPEGREENWSSAYCALSEMDMDEAKLSGLLDVLPTLIRRRPALVSEINLPCRHVPINDRIRKKMQERPELREAVMWALRIYPVGIHTAWDEFFNNPESPENLDRWVSDGLANLWVQGLPSGDKKRGWWRPLVRHMEAVREFVGEGLGSGLRAHLYMYSGIAPLLDVQCAAIYKDTEDEEEAAETARDVYSFWTWVNDQKRPSALATWAARAPTHRITLLVREWN